MTGGQRERERLVVSLAHIRSSQGASECSHLKKLTEQLTKVNSNWSILFKLLNPRGSECVCIYVCVVCVCVYMIYLLV